MTDRPSFRISRSQIRLIVFLSVGVGLSIVLNGFMKSGYSGYPGHMLKASAPYIKGEDPFVQAVGEIPYGLLFGLLNHPLSYYACAGLFVISLHFSSVRPLLSDAVSRSSSIMAVLASVGAFVHFLFFKDMPRHGYWESFVVNGLLLVMTLPTMIIVNHAVLIALLSVGNTDRSTLQSRLFQRRALVFSLTAMLMIVLNIFTVSPLALSMQGIAGGPKILALLIGFGLYFTLDQYLRWLLQVPKRRSMRLLRVMTFVAIFVVQVIAHILIGFLLQGWVPQTVVGGAFYWFLFYGTSYGVALYSVLIMANGMLQEVRHVA